MKKKKNRRRRKKKEKESLAEDKSSRGMVEKSEPESSKVSSHKAAPKVPSSSSENSEDEKIKKLVPKTCKLLDEEYKGAEKSATVVSKTPSSDNTSNKEYKDLPELVSFEVAELSSSSETPRQKIKKSDRFVKGNVCRQRKGEWQEFVSSKKEWNESIYMKS